jgi:hypothetical protein
MVRRLVAACAALIAISTQQAAAQTNVIAQLDWDGFSAGPRAQDYPAGMDERDLWVMEDFQITTPWLVGTLSCAGASIRAGITGVAAVILDDLPPKGQILMQTVPGTGRYIDASPWGRFEADFGGQRLAPGAYWIMWAAQGDPDQILPVMFVTRGEYSVGMGIPDNALQYNPGLWWNLPDGALDPVTEGLNNEGPPVGVNFSLRGEPAPPSCPVDFNNDGAVNSQDFFAYLTSFFASEAAADFNRDDAVNSQDLFDFLAAFFTGC